MKKTHLLFLGMALVCVSPSFAIDKMYVGGEMGNVGLTGTNASSYNSGMGFGVNVGVRISPIVDVTFELKRSGHAGAGSGLTLWTQTTALNLHYFENEDVDLSVGAGPGIYFTRTDVKNLTKFGGNVGTSADFVIDRRFRLGVDGRVHFTPPSSAGIFWTAMMRLGYMFTL